MTTTSLLALGCGPTVYANPKGCYYDDGGYKDGISGQPCNLDDGGEDADATVQFGDASKDAAKDGAGDATTSDAAADAADAADAVADAAEGG